MSPESLVVLEPPQPCGGEHDVLGARRAPLLEPSNRLAAVGRVVAGIAPGIVAREVPRTATLHPEQFFVAPADDEHGRTRGHCVDHGLPYPFGELSVRIARAALVGPPWFPPLLL